MDRQRVFRRLRWGVSAAVGLLCVPLAVMSARSGEHRDVVTLGIGRGPGFILESVSGSMTFFYIPLRTGYVAEGWDGAVLTPEESFVSKFDLHDYRVVRFRHYGGGMFVAALPYRTLLVAAAILAALPWLSWTFSLRTLFFATTLIAVVLGLVVWMSRSSRPPPT